MTTDSAGIHIVGTIRRTAEGKGAVRMEDVYDTDIDDLWSAVTDPERLTRWIADVHGDLRLGGAIHATFTSSWEGPGRIDVCQAPHHLLLTMSPGTDEETVIEATLASEGDKARLVIEERGLPVDVLAGHGAGWQAHVEDLTAHLQGRTTSDWRTRWAALAPAYNRLAEGLS
jgi:uncharacterized protein YndB with AHSA1/START domain